jgi:hypothetical protein
MTILLPALAVSFAAFCVWLGVRIVNRRERWAKRMAVALTAAVMLYVLSVGAVCRMLTLAGDPGWAVEAYHTVYAPIWWIYDNGPQPIRSAIWWYCRTGT